MDSLITTGRMAYFKVDIAIDLEDPITQKQIKELQEFFSMTPFEDEMTNFPLFICQVIMKYNELRGGQAEKKVDDAPESNVKISLDTAQLDEAITKADALIAKLKTAQVIINYINSK